ncbi:hypothetical protein SUGI_0071620 [Cryptomeria japonica]|nr:hypothetical protein SUGI_0071620 [Cryptomeria japonica]
MLLRRKESTLLPLTSMKRSVDISQKSFRNGKKALSEVSLYSGQIINNNGDEMRLFKNMVNIVLKEIRDVQLVVAKHPVGLDEAVEDFENTLQLVSSDQGVQIVGIWGMGGSGKITLAKELYNKRFFFMESRQCRARKQIAFEELRFPQLEEKGSCHMENT